MLAHTDNQRRFVDHLVSTGCTPTEAARVAGYDHPAQEAYRLIRKPHIVAAIGELRGRLISSHGANVATKTLIDIMQDVAAPASARVSAARTMYEAAGQFTKGLDPDREVPLHEMTSAQLEAFIANAQTVIDNGGSAPVIRVIDRVKVPVTH
jgi:Terminase small subunit